MIDDTFRQEFETKAREAGRALVAAGFTTRNYRMTDLAFSCLLVRAGTVVARVSNDGHGGCHRFEWIDPTQRETAEKSVQQVELDEPLDAAIDAILDGVL